MRVAHVVRQFHPGVGGLEAFVLSLAKQQRLEGVSAEVVTLDRLFSDRDTRLPRHDSVESVPVRRIPFTGSTRYPFAPAILSSIQQYDIVHVHGVDFFCDFLALTRPLHRKPLVISTHGGYFHSGFARLLKRAFFHTATRASLRRYARVFACSANDDSIFRKVARRRLLRIDNGVDVAKFADAASRKFRPTFVYFGRFSNNKGLERLVDAFDLLCDDIKDARLHIMGCDWDDVIPALNQRIASARHGRAVTIHVDPTDDDIRRVVSKSCFFVSASNYEGFGLALVEAMSAGLVPIASQIPSFVSILGRSGVGLLCPFEDADLAGREMAAFVRETVASYGDRRADAMQLADRYSWPKVSRRFTRQYEDVLGRREREIFGVRMRPMGRKRAISTIDRALGSGQVLKVSFANAHTLTTARRNIRFRAALQHFLVLNDGVGVDIASWLKFGRRFAANLNGTDLVPDFLDQTQHNLRIFLIGTTEAAVTEAAARLRIRYPRHRIVGWRDGFFSDADEIDEACRTVRAAEADCVLVGMGNPLQELWIDEHGAKTGAKLLIGVGALFDFSAGSVRRAPMWVRKARCEWAYRLLQEPRRLGGRYLIGNLVFLSRVLAEGRRFRVDEA